MRALAMSALPPKADIERGDGHVRFVPKADIGSALDCPCPNLMVGIPAGLATLYVG